MPVRKKKPRMIMSKMLLDMNAIITKKKVKKPVKRRKVFKPVKKKPVRKKLK